MPDYLPVDHCLKRRQNIPLLDVRTPAEYEQGHIPGAVNLPLFPDEGRAEIGTIYKSQGREVAILRGLELVGPRLRQLVEDAVAVAPDNEVYVHCWRGGMRSEAAAWLLSFYGMKASCVSGGYKAYRQHAVELFNRSLNVVVVGGLTGSGKTEVLQALKDRGEQILDLEEIARHQGSVFGHLGMPDQPTQEQFENDLAQALRHLDPQRLTWVEDESRRIGRIVLPPPLYEAKAAAPVVMIERPREERVDRLVRGYGSAGTDALVEAIKSISKKLGGDRTKEAIGMVVEGRLAEASSVLLDYYDRTYLHALGRRDVDVRRFQLPPGCSAPDAAHLLINHYGATRT